jgi:hypothetical protein
MTLGREKHNIANANFHCKGKIWFFGTLHFAFICNEFLFFLKPEMRYPFLPFGLFLRFDFPLEPSIRAAVRGETIS